ncbi:MAG: 16S rRNA processing protein RimM [Oscillibacter sp.]|nr:16S rRNA processing protein RimM [Oscillibacter sp.]
MKLEMIPAGRVTGVHGIRGELRVLPLERDAAFLAGLKRLWLDGQPLAPACRIHKGMVLMKLPGVEDRTAAEALRGKELLLRREDADLPPGGCFDAELLGMEVYNGETGECVGELVRVEDYPASKVYTVRGVKDFLVPAVPEAFILGVDLENNRMDIRVWEGLTE